MIKNKRANIATAFSLCFALALSSCGGSESSPKPEAKAETGTAAKEYIANYADDAAVGQSVLIEGIAPLFEDPDMAETRAVVILHGGLVVAERYAPGYGPDSKLISWSMAKSVTATLIGLMVADGRLALDEPAPVAAWRGANDDRRKITLRHLLHMASGLDHTEGLSPDSGIQIYEADTTRMLFLDGQRGCCPLCRNADNGSEAGREI